MEKPEEYFLKLIKSGKKSVTICGDEPVSYLDKQLPTVLTRKGITYKELYNAEPDLSSYKTICLCIQDNKLGGIEIRKLLTINPKLKVIVVQTLSTYKVVKEVIEGFKITIVCFNRQRACFIENKLSDGHPFFLLENTIIPKQILEWDDWIETQID